MKKLIATFLLLSSPAFAQQDYRLQRDVCLDTSSQVSALWTARYSDATIKLQEQQAKITELEKKIVELEAKK
jgi:hypothetical protein